MKDKEERAGWEEDAAPQTQNYKGLIQTWEDFGEGGRAKEPAERAQTDAEERPYGR